MLYLGQKLWIPLGFGLLISLILYPVTRWLELRGWPKIVAIVSSLSLLFTLLFALLALLTFQFSQFLNNWPQMQQKLEAALIQALASLGTLLNITALEQQAWIDALLKDGLEYLVSWLPQGLYTAGVSLVLLLLVPFYAVLILYYRQILLDFLHRITQGWSYDKLLGILKKSIHTYFGFIKGVSLVYLIVGVLNSIGLSILGVPNAILFGFIASILTFIPYVGITIGALLPITVAWLTFDSIFYPLGVVGIFVVVQILEANVIFPLIVSHHLKINALAAIVVIVVGGLLWGGAGMILLLPFVAMLKLIIEEIDQDHPLAILLR